MIAPRIERFWLNLKNQSLSYTHLEITKSSSLPVGFYLDQHRIKLGNSATVFRQAKAALKSWKAHQSSWIQAYPISTPLEIGQNVVIAVGIAKLQLLSGCRIIYVVDEPRMFGFAYGTLQQHPACGEERFLLEWLEDDSVVFSLYAVSKPANWFYRLAAPITRRIQFLASQAYLQAMYKAVQL
ncbi:MAG: hypothetical protein RLZZ156_2206 [Deinococcota bacterium]